MSKGIPWNLIEVRCKRPDCLGLIARDGDGVGVCSDCEEDEDDRIVNAFQVLNAFFHLGIDVTKIQSVRLTQSGATYHEKRLILYHEDDMRYTLGAPYIEEHIQSPYKKIIGKIM